MIWRATVRMNGIPIEGYDRLIDGEGSMRWKLLGVIPADLSLTVDQGRLKTRSV
jgi:hypothetical protein